MAIAFDAAGSNLGGGGTSSLSFSITIGGANRLLIVGVDVRDTTTTSSVTYNSIALTKLLTNVYSGGAELTMWYLVAPTGGTNTVLVTLGAACGGAEAGGVSLTGVNQTNPIDNSTTTSGAAGTATSISLTTRADQCWMIDVMGQNTGTLSHNAGQTSRWNRAGTGSGGASETTGPITPAGLATLSWTFSGLGGPTDWGECAASISPFIPPVTIQENPHASATAIRAQYRTAAY